MPKKKVVVETVATEEVAEVSVQKPKDKPTLPYSEDVNGKKVYQAPDGCTYHRENLPKQFRAMI